MVKVDHRLDEMLARAGLSRTVYALVTPEVEALLDEVLDGDASRRIQHMLQSQLSAGVPAEARARAIARELHAGRAPLHALYRDAWSRKQDGMDRAFFEAWFDWTGEVVGLTPDRFPFQYPTAGASEGLRAAIDDYGNRARHEGFRPAVHVLDGEYEGFAAYAQAARIPVVRHDRRNWREVPGRIGPNDQFYISQPSSIDGNLWPDFDAFAAALQAAQPTAQLMLDLTYVGCVARPFRVVADHPNIRAVFFSLSKPAGVYYHRIGGCLSRVEYGGLFGNRWFKNLLSLRLGTAFMERYQVREMPQKIRALQGRATAAAHERLGLDLEPSDVVLLASGRPRGATYLECHLTRGAGREAPLRACLTPALARLIRERAGEGGTAGLEVAS